MRHGLAVRIVHWLIVLEGAFLIISGFQLGAIFPIGLPEDTYSFHIMAGIAFIFTAFVFLYTVVAAGDFKWFSPRRLALSFRYTGAETLAWFRVRPRLHDPIDYSPKKGDYVEKLIPSVIVVWWAYAIMGIIMALTGLAKVYPSSFSFVYSITDPIGIALTGAGGLSFVLAVHRLTAIVLVCVVALHVYASYVYRMIGSILHGHRDEPTTESERGGDAPVEAPLGDVPIARQSSHRTDA